MQISRRALPGLAAAAALAACSTPTEKKDAGASGSAGGSSLTLGDPIEQSGFSPINGYGVLGVNPLYDGLLRPRSSSDRKLPTFAPALASSSPRAKEGGRLWVVPLRKGVTWHDGKPFGPKDVVETYRAILDPDVASPISSDFEMVSKVTAGPGRAVTFHLKYAFADFPTLLTQSIAPAHLIGEGPADRSPLNTKPVGTGPYRLQKRTAERAIFRANPDYFRGRVPIQTVTRLHLPEDNSRAQRMLAGDFDGTALPPALAKTMDGKKGLTVHRVHSSDWRSVAFPRNDFTRDPRVRIALNHAVDRKAIVRTVLAGSGTPTSFPVPAAFGDLVDHDLGFDYDVRKAGELLDAAGFRKGKGGFRAKGSTEAALTLFYPSDDTVRRDLATAFASYAKKVGVKVTLKAATWDEVESDLARLALLLGGGERPYSIDSLLYPAMHRRTPQTSSPYANAGNIGNAKIDKALEEGRRALDATDRRRAYRAVQREFMKDPNAVHLCFLDHTYVARTNDWNTGPMLLEPHGHDVSLGPWWDIPSWRR